MLERRETKIGIVLAIAIAVVFAGSSMISPQPNKPEGILQTQLTIHYTDGSSTIYDPQNAVMKLLNILKPTGLSISDSSTGKEMSSIDYICKEEISWDHVNIESFNVIGQTLFFIDAELKHSIDIIDPTNILNGVPKKISHGTIPSAKITEWTGAITGNHILKIETDVTVTITSIDGEVYTQSGKSVGEFEFTKKVGQILYVTVSVNSTPMS